MKIFSGDVQRAWIASQPAYSMAAVPDAVSAWWVIMSGAAHLVSSKPYRIKFAASLPNSSSNPSSTSLVPWSGRVNAHKLTGSIGRKART